MILQIDDWKFDVDVQSTMAYSSAEAATHCDCAYCRNFYAAMDGSFPKLRPFLAQFGIDMEAPDELMPITATNMMAFYAVSGHILQYGKNPVMACGVRIDPEPHAVSMIPTECPAPFFVLSVGAFDLPWVLEEPLVEEEIVSPANEPSFLQKMWNKLLGKASKSNIES